jgi:hypothetical protein
VKLESTQKNVVEDLMKPLRIFGRNQGGVHVNMVLIMPSQKPGSIPGQSVDAWLQKKARALDRAKTKDVSFCGMPIFVAA